MNSDQLWHIGSLVGSLSFFAVILHKALRRIRGLLAEWREMKKAVGSMSVESTESTEEGISFVSVLVVAIGTTFSALVLYNLHLQQTSPTPTMSFIASVFATLNMLGTLLGAFGERIYRFFKTLKKEHQVLQEQIKAFAFQSEQHEREIETLSLQCQRLEQIIEVLAREQGLLAEQEQFPVQRKLAFMAQSHADKVDLLRSVTPRRSNH